MKDLISERPNIMPVGLGNSESGIDMSVYDTGYKSDTYESKPVTEVDEDDNMLDNDDDKDDEDDEDMVSIRQKHSQKKKNKGTPARKTKPLKSKTPSKMKKLKALGRFAELASAEEITN